MTARRRFINELAMASRWRRRQMCVLLGERPHSASLRRVSASGAFVETNARPPIGCHVMLLHPDAGQIDAIVDSHCLDGIGIIFDRSAPAAAFALTAIAADMSCVTAAAL